MLKDKKYQNSNHHKNRRKKREKWINQFFSEAKK
jgi:hypothetical protein